MVLLQKDRRSFMATQKDYFADEIGTLKLDKEPKGKILAGDVGYLITGIKQAKEVKVGDTITDAQNQQNSNRWV